MSEKKIVKLKHTPRDPVTDDAGQPTLYHFEIDRKHYDQFDLEMLTNPKNRKTNFVLNSFAGKVTRYIPPKIENGAVTKQEQWKDEPMSKETFHVLIQTSEWGVIVSATVNLLQGHYGGSDDIEDFLQ
ncbi:hypothetical protein KAR91_73775 [Candidatus Pacearchaeota archaeon]|nr:hypothetical protein [Candidatus Pacearchaeota archaeon]